MRTRENIGTSARELINYDHSLALAYVAAQVKDENRPLGAVLWSHVNNARINWGDFQCDNATLRFEQAADHSMGNPLIVSAYCRHRIAWPLRWVLGDTEHGKVNFGRLPLRIIKSEAFSHRDPIV